MALNIRKVGEVADGSVTVAKLADGAVTSIKIADAAVIEAKVASAAITSTKISDSAVVEAKIATDAVVESKIAANAVVESKIANSAVVEAKLANLAISTGKLQNNVVTLAKADNDIKAITFVGDETELSVAGSAEEAIKEFSFSKKGGTLAPNFMRVLMTLKSDSEIATGTANVYINGEGSPRGTMTTVASAYELVSDEFAIDNLANGKHLVSVRLVSSEASATVFNDYLDILLVK